MTPTPQRVQFKKSSAESAIMEGRDWAFQYIFISILFCCCLFLLFHLGSEGKQIISPLYTLFVEWEVKWSGSKLFFIFTYYEKGPLENLVRVLLVRRDGGTCCWALLGLCLPCQHREMPLQRTLVEPSHWKKGLQDGLEEYLKYWDADISEWQDRMMYFLKEKKKNKI